MTLPPLRSPEELTDLVCEIGFLPFFNNPVPGFSVEECCPPELWFVDGVDGPWEWKGPAIRTRRLVYGKFFRGKAGYVSLDWLPDLANLRRDGYDFDARYDDGLSSAKDKAVFDIINENAPIVSTKLRDLAFYKRGGNSGFETVITRLQMQTYVVCSDFVYATDKHGNPYGWGTAEYSTPEHLLGRTLPRSAYSRTPEESRTRILTHLASTFPDVPADLFAKLMK